MKLTLVRHGETEENRNGIVQGQNPGTLSPLGIKQSKEVAKQLSDRDFDVIYSSDLQRCKDTVKEIRTYHLGTPLKFVPDLREISFGLYQGKPSKSVNWSALEGTALTKKAPEGESWTDLSQRVERFLNKIYRQHPNQSVLLITHGGPMRVVKSFIDKLPLAELIHEKIDNCAVWELEMNAPIDSSILH